MAFLVVALGGALGAVLRWAVGDAVPDGPGFPWTTFTVNVTGSLVLAALPALGAVRHRPLLTAALGPGLLGGYTTLSAYSEQTRDLLADGRTGSALGYLLGTLVACLVAVALVSHLSGRLEQAEFAAEGGDE